MASSPNPTRDEFAALLDESLGGAADEGLVDGDLQAHLGDEVGLDLLAAVQLLVLLLAMTRDPAHRDPEDLGVDQLSLIHI